jgi:hypothetical protein
MDDFIQVQFLMYRAPQTRFLAGGSGLSASTLLGVEATDRWRLVSPM